MDSLHVVASDARRGAETFAVQLAAVLRSCGERAYVVALQSSGGATTHEIPTFGTRRRSPRSLRALRRVAGRFDVVVAHGSTTLEACAMALAGTRTPFVYRTIGDPSYWAGDMARHTWVGQLLKRAARHVVLWPAAADELCSRYGLARDLIDVIPNAVLEGEFVEADDLERREARREFGIDPDVACLVYVGALSPEKGVSSAIRCIEHMPGAVLLLAGDGPDRDGLADQARHLDPSSVQFLGSIADLRRLYAAADLVLLPSKSEGMPGVIIEAGLVGTPVVATRVGAVPEMIEDGVTGFLAPPNDPSAFVDRVGAALPQVRIVGQRLPASFRQAYSMATVARQWRKSLDEAVSTPTHRQRR